VLRRRVGEADVLVDVVSGQHDGAVSRSRDTVNEPSVPIAVTVHVSRLRTGSPAEMISERSFRRVATPCNADVISPFDKFDAIAHDENVRINTTFPL
jgi:hypothetical protein